MLPPQAASPLEGEGLGKMGIEPEVPNVITVQDELEEGELLPQDDNPSLTLVSLRNCHLHRRHTFHERRRLKVQDRPSSTQPSPSLHLLVLSLNQPITFRAKKIRISFASSDSVSTESEAVFESLCSEEGPTQSANDRLKDLHKLRLDKGWEN
jgi:hypothetical protein